MKKNIIFLILLGLSLGSCSYGVEEIFGRNDPVSVRVADKTARPYIDPGVSAPFRFIITSDLHFGSPIGPDAARMSAFQDVLNLENPAFVAYCGDLADHGQESETLAFRAFTDNLTNTLSLGLPIPWFSAIGNHDLYNDGWQYYKKNVGPSYFHFSAGSVSFYVIDTANGSVGDDQLGMLKMDFAADPKPKIVLTHYPIRGNDSFLYGRLTGTRERAILLDLFGRSRVKAVFVGHQHYQYTTDCNNYIERICGSFINSDIDNHGHGWVVDVDAAGEVTAREFTL